MEDLLRVVGVSPRVHVGNVQRNVEEIERKYKEYYEKADIIVTPELSLTAYTCADYFAHRKLIDDAMKGLAALVDMTARLKRQDLEQVGSPLLFVGMPFEYESELWNVAVVICDGRILGVVPKTYLPNYGEFYEKRWFSAKQVDCKTINVLGQETKFGNNILFHMNSLNVTIGTEICEDAWTPVSPGRIMAINGAEVIINLSASNEVIGKENYRKTLIGNLSATCICGYVYASAGQFESTSDIVFSGHKLAYVNGKCVGEIKPFEDGDLVCDLELNKIRHDRIVNKSFVDCKSNFNCRQFLTIECDSSNINKEHMINKVSMTPFVPSNNVRKRCLSIFQMQVAGLQRRLEATKSKCIIVGVSGGLDSTLALLVSAQAVRNLGLPSTTVVGITMPGFGTTSRTKNNSITLMEVLGCDIRTISIVDSVRQHFLDIGQEEAVHDITYENCQARERTQILMDVANKEGGFVIGTGDLSELVLGWCTYNGDHMSMYGVNNSIPKTLVRSLVDEIGHEMDENGFEGMAPVIEDIIDTPVSPELLPPNPDGTIAQKTEDTVGSYILHDFFLYYTLRYGMEPKDLKARCLEAILQNPEYQFSEAEVDKWLQVFYRRFFQQQFKRNCMPDGVKVGTVSVSPRGDLRLPSEIEWSGEYVYGQAD